MTELKIESLSRRWVAAAHKVQTGIAALMNMPGGFRSCETKHLRVGIDTTKADLGSLGRLLVAKGVCTEEELLTAIAEGMEAEAADYEARVSEAFGKKVTLS